MLRHLLLLVVLGLAGCFPYYGLPGEPHSDTQAWSGALEYTHEGWGDPRCWDCHVPAAHNSGLAPYQCVECHGTNGARRGHTNVTPCAECHGWPHGVDGFPDPDACQTCHIR